MLDGHRGIHRIIPDIRAHGHYMPQMEGIEAVERIVRKHRQRAHRMVSSVGYPGEYPGGPPEGAKHFVQKPVKPEVLYEICVRAQRRSQRVAPPVAMAESNRS